VNDATCIDGSYRVLLQQTYTPGCVYQAIAQALIPEVASVCLRTAGDCIKKKIEW